MKQKAFGNDASFIVDLQRKNGRMMRITDGWFPLRRFLTPLGIAVATLATAAFLTACDRREHKQTAPPETATIAVTTLYHTLLADIALSKDYFRQEGLEVTPRLHAYGKPALEDMMAGYADFATVAETPIMFAILDGMEISILATIFKTNTDHAIVARKDKGIVTPDDLRNRKIATTFGTTAEFFLHTFLAINAISKKHIELINLPQEELPQALAEGRVDAASAFGQFRSSAKKQLGDKGTVFLNKYINTTTFHLVSTREFVRQNPGKVGKVLRAFYRAEQFFAENPEEGLKIAAEFNQEDISTLREMLAGPSVELSLDLSLILTLEDESRWAIENGRTSARNVPNFLDHIYLEGLKSVKPAAVRILE